MSFLEKIILPIFTTGLCYSFYNYQIFKSCGYYLDVKIKRKYYLIMFIINYSLFIIISFMQIPLTINWIVFSLFLILEITYIFHVDWSTGIFLGLFCGIFGLIINILLRTIFALLLDIPMIYFDSSTLGERIGIIKNVKQFSISIGFLITAVILMFSKTKKYGTLHHLKNCQISISNIRFLSNQFIVVYVYMALCLAIFSLKSNANLLKLWSLKSSIFAYAFVALIIRYETRITQINTYKSRTIQIEKEIIAWNSDKQRLYFDMYQDELTHCYNRRYAQQLFEEWNKDDKKGIVCFIDINHLKKVNDRFNHMLGDRYICVITDILKSKFQNQVELIRYGGDEFLLLFEKGDISLLMEQLAKIDLELKKLSFTNRFPFKLSISYGVVDMDEFSGTIEDAVYQADKLMYENKKNQSLK